MPEGHTIRHLATAHSYGFVGEKVETSSPQGRFLEGADLLNGQVMTNTSAHGKHLFLHFEKDILHVHLGLYGWFSLYKNKSRQPKDSVRLRIENDRYLSDLVGPTACEIYDFQMMQNKISKLGPDPIHENADPEKAWVKIKKSSKTFGALLMDQSVIAGIGNVYRAELLFLSKISPFTPGKEINEEQFATVWSDACRLLKLGAEDGKIKTVFSEHLLEEEVKLHGCTQYSYVYKRTNQFCRLCKQVIKSDKLDGRTVYWCPTCQV
jgi:endonuclease-8